MNKNYFLPMIVLSVFSLLGLVWGKEDAVGTGYAYNERFANYYQNANETPSRVRWIHQKISLNGLQQQCVPIEPLSNPLYYIRLVHDSAHIAGIQNIPLNPQMNATEPVGPIAELAVGYVLGAVRDVCSGKIRNAFCNIRPPGHHVTNGGYLSGYCAYANVVIAARYAQKEMGLEKILIIDWDCHHGNGTVHFVCSDTNILFLETGTYNNFYNQCNTIIKRHIISVDVGGKRGNEEFVETFKKTFFPAADDFGPQLVLISCGFDLKVGDPVCGGSLRVTAKGVSKLTLLAMEIANKHCGGKLVSILEGGYADTYGSDSYNGLAECAYNHLATLISGKQQPETPFFGGSEISFRTICKNSKIDNSLAKNIYDLQGKHIQFNFEKDNSAIIKKGVSILRIYSNGRNAIVKHVDVW